MCFGVFWYFCDTRFKVITINALLFKMLSIFDNGDIFNDGSIHDEEEKGFLNRGNL